MVDFPKEREAMVKFQLEARGIGDRRILAAFGQIERELFLPEEYRDLTYVDGPIPIGHGQTISQPLMVALMTEALKPEAGDRVLEIGTGSGYQAAVLSRLVSEVYTVERIPELADRARKIFEELGIKNYELRVGDGTKGWEEKAPFDKIIVTAATAKVPQALFDQLPVGGILLAPVGPPDIQELMRYTKDERGWSEESLGGCRFVPLI